MNNEIDEEKFGLALRSDGLRTIMTKAKANVPDKILIDVNDAASMRPPASASRHRTEFAANAIIARIVKIHVGKSVAPFFTTSVDTIDNQRRNSAPG